MKYEIKSARLKQPRNLERVELNKSGYRELMKSINQEVTESKNQDQQNDDEGKGEAEGNEEDAGENRSTRNNKVEEE